MNSYSFKKVSENIIEKIVEDNKNFLSTSKNPSIKYLFRLPQGLVVNIYTTNTILLQGDEIELFANKYGLKMENKVTNSISNQKIALPNIGCDEVGVGDFFGPLVTCCVYIDKDFEVNYPSLASQITDSKKINDFKIIDLFDQLKDKITWEVYVLENSKYNKAYDIYRNTHTLKAICHNQALKRIFRNNPELEKTQIIMDQFVDERNYYKYLADQEIIIKNIYFETKAEAKYISVACASIIARYHFLKEIEKLENEYDVKLPLGANNHVKALVNQYKSEKPQEIDKFTKMHFNSKI
ncbi:ribonuclease HIII [Spiroplasma endosymbiont of Diplazon laetatorius]|uniref:ribonuclease HIII n=1 Tax=Spiroplasma endosymbiont of Diplazon laetatorius TaxID=3066322 RepID=UPI0030CF95FF